MTTVDSNELNESNDSNDQPWLCFSTPGEMDLRSISIMGLGAKPSAEGAIGRFGTGLKYAIAGILRLGGRVEVWIGEEFYEFKTQLAEFRGHSYDGIEMWTSHHERLTLPFTADLGKHWPEWGLLRELWSNTKDEQGTIWQDNSQVESVWVPGRTLFRVQCRELNEVWARKGEFFLETAPLFSLPSFSLHPPSGGPGLFYQTIRVSDDRPGRFSYELLGSVDLTEDRTLTDGWGVKTQLVKELLACDIPAVCETVCRTGEKEFEVGLDFDRWGVEVSATFTAEALEAEELGLLQNQSIKRLLKRLVPEEFEIAGLHFTAASGGETPEIPAAELPSIPYELWTWQREVEAHYAAARKAAIWWRQQAQAQRQGQVVKEPTKEEFPPVPPPASEDDYGLEGWDERAQPPK